MEDNQQPSDDGQQTPMEAPEEQSPPQQGQSLSYNPPQPPEKSGKKKMIILLVIFLLIAGGAAAWYFLFKSDGDTNNTSNENSSNEEQQSAFTPTYFVQTGPLVEYVNAAGELETEANLAANDVVTDVRNASDGTRVYYYSTTPSDFWSEVISSYSYVSGGNKTELLSIAEGNANYAAPVLSPDETKAVSELGYTGDGLMGDIYLHDLESGTSEVLYETNKNLDQTRDLFVIVGWLDDKTVLLQEQTCRECDGPRKAVLNKLDVETGELSDFFNSDDSIDTLGWAQFFLSDSKIYVFGGDYAKIFGGPEEGVEFTPDELYEIDTSSGEPRLITTFNNVFVEPSNIDDSTLYVTLKDLEPTTEENAILINEAGSFGYSQPTLQAVDLNTGSTRPVALETKYFTKDSYVKTFINTENSVLFLTETSFTQDVEDPELGMTRKSGVDFAVFELPTGAEETALKLLKEQRSLYDESFVPVQLFKAE